MTPEFLRILLRQLRRQQALAGQVGDHIVSQLIDPLVVGIENQFGILRSFVGGIDPGEVLHLARAGLLVQPLRIALLAGFQRGVDVDLVEFAVLEQSANLITVGLEREMNAVRAITPASANSLATSPMRTNVLGPVLGAEAQVLVQTMRMLSPSRM